MQKGLTFRGIHSASLGVSVKTRSRPVLPEARRLTFEPAAADGVRDLSAFNSRGRVLYSERRFTADMHVSADDVDGLQRKLARIASWLCGSGELVFDDLPDVVWKASMLGMLDYAPERAGKQAILSAEFNAEPFSYAPFTARQGIPIGSSRPIGSDIPIGLPGILTYTLGASGTVEALNIGTAPTRPVITINDPFGTYTAEINGVSIEAEIGASADALVIDCENYRVYAVNGSGYLRFSGTFPELFPGMNEIRISGIGIAGKTVTVDYRPRFLYGWEV